MQLYNRKINLPYEGILKIVAKKSGLTPPLPSSVNAKEFQPIQSLFLLPIIVELQI